MNEKEGEKDQDVVEFKNINFDSLVVRPCSSFQVYTSLSIIKSWGLSGEREYILVA